MKKSLNVFLLAAVVLPLLSVPGFSAEKIKVAATTSTFASLTREITGDAAEVYYVASPKQDVHFTTPTPRDVFKVKKADVFVHGGLDLELWRQPLLNAVGRMDIMEHGNRAIDVSRGVTLLEVPADLSRIHGDVHAFGNPHYWMSPDNVKIMAANIAEGLSSIYPDRAADFRARQEDFSRRLDAAAAGWRKQLEPFAGEEVVAYHNCWPYFTEYFRIKMAGFLEPKPGITPTPRHLNGIIQTAKERKVKAVIRERFQESGTPKKFASATGASIVTLTQEAGEAGEDYFKMMDRNISLLAEAFRKGRAS